MSDANLEKDLNATTDMFKLLHSSMKSGFPIWEDFIQRGQRFQRSLEQLIASFSSFLDGFARLADIAGQSKGGTQEIGASLTNLVRWHKAVELKIREINYSFTSKLLTPIGNRLDEWKRSLSALEKDHDKEMSKSIKDSKEALKGTIKLAKSLEAKRKKDRNIGPLLQQYEQMQMETDQKMADTELKEKVHMSRLMVEERVWFSLVSNALKSVLDNEVTLTNDLERLPQLIEEMTSSTSSPSILPEPVRDYIENWQVPTVQATRNRTGSHSAQQVHNTFSNSSMSLESDTMNISSPMTTIAPSVTSLGQSEAPPLGNHLQSPPEVGVPQLQAVPPPPPTAPPPLASTGNYRQPLPEEVYDVPVCSAYVSVSPSQVSLVSNGSHHSSDSTHSSTRSASPPYSHLAPQSQLPRPQQSTPPSQYPSQSTDSRPRYPTPPGDQRPQYPAPPTDPYSTYQQPHPVNPLISFQQELLSKQRQSYETDLEYPNQFKALNSNIESSRYIPATLPRPPKKPAMVPPVKQKPVRSTSSVHQQMSSPAHSMGVAPQLAEDDEDDSNNSAFAQALRQKQLRRAATVNDRSAPKV